MKLPVPKRNRAQSPGRISKDAIEGAQKGSKGAPENDPDKHGSESTMRRSRPIWTEIQPQLAQWYSSGLGQSILSELEGHLENSLSGVFGYQGLQLGTLPGAKPILENAGIHRGIFISSQQSDADIRADVLKLPIASDVMKLVVMPHTLDFCHRPHQALREADRVLTEDGQLLIIGFNPFSLFGVGHALLGWRGNAPWNAGFFSRRRVTEWLSVLNFQLLDSSCFYLRPPLKSGNIQHRLAGVERLRPWLGMLGGVYVLHARKKTIPLSLVRQRKRQRKALGVSGLASSSRVGSLGSTAPLKKEQGSNVVALPVRS